MKLLIENWREYLNEDESSFPYQIYCDMDGVLVDLVGYWKFNEGSGTTVKDYGPYEKHGTLTSDAENGSGVPTWGTAPTGYGK